MELQQLGYMAAKLIMTVCNKILSKFNLVLSIKMRSLGRKRNSFVYTYDYIRNSSLELIGHEINTRKINGSTAELGVYRGDFAKNINITFPDRKLYLFDTFEGFAERDIKTEKNGGYSRSKTGYFSSTSVELVLRKMKYRENCVIKKGCFPDTVLDVDERFVFVSIDCDLFEPILSGLEYFYPRLEKGGYIFVHEYNYSRFSGARDAVNKYIEKREDICYFPLSDHNGTMVITK
jgi:O-methyltransferase